MPIYEYRCEGCGRKVSLLLKRMGEEADRCPRCGSPHLVRLYSRFSLARSDGDRLDRLADDAAFAGVDESDPRSVARFMRRMGQELGEEAGEDFQQGIEEMESGRRRRMTPARSWRRSGETLRPLRREDLRRRALRGLPRLLPPASGRNRGSGSPGAEAKQAQGGKLAQVKVR